MFAAVRMDKRNLSWRLISVFSLWYGWSSRREVGHSAHIDPWGMWTGSVLNQNHLQNSSDEEYLKSPKLNLSNKIAVVQQTHLYINETWESNSCWIHLGKYNSNSVPVDMKETILQNSNLFSLITELIYVTYCKQNVGEDRVAMTVFLRINLLSFALYIWETTTADLYFLYLFLNCWKAKHLKENHA